MSGKIHALVIPKYGMVMTEGVLAAWHVDEGKAVRPGDEIIDIETEKIVNAYETQVGGVLRRRVAQDGETLPVGALFAVIADASVADAEIDAFIADFQANFQAADAGESGPSPQVIDAGGLRVRYLLVGEGKSIPVLLVHGFGGDLNNWLFNQGALAVDRAVYAPDLPGHGGSQKSVGDGSIAFLAGTILDFLSATGLGRVHLVGHSLGGAIGLYLGIQRPDVVASLTLISPAGLGSEINPAFIEGLVRADRRKEMTAVLQYLFHEPDLVSREMVMNVLNAKRIDGAVQCLQRIAQSCFPGGRQAWNCREDLPRVSAPLQVIWGAEDGIIPPSHAGNLGKGTVVHLLEGVGHMAHMERSTEVNRLIQQFIEAA